MNAFLWGYFNFIFCYFSFLLLFLYFSINCLFCLYFLLFFMFFSTFLTFLFVSSFNHFIMMLIFFMLGEFFRHISHTCPIFKNLFMLAPHFNKKSSIEYLTVETVSNKIDGVNFHLKNDFKRPRIVVFDFDEFIFRESFLYIFFSSFKIALDEIERYMLNFIIEGLDLVNNFFLFGIVKFSLILLLAH